MRRRLIFAVGAALLVVGLSAGCTERAEDSPGPSSSEEAEAVRVPDVVGLKSSDATAQLTGAGFDVVVDGSGDGTVSQQDPAPGAAVAKGSTVTITVG